MTDETTPLLHNHDASGHHEQFCLLVGIPPFDKPSTSPHPPSCKALYTRALRKYRGQNTTYTLTAALANTLLLSQVVLGALLTALGASSSSYKLITIFGVLNTIIAGLVAYLKSRGQPMRARMFRDDLEEVVDEIEDSRTMWLGIKHGVHGYDEIDVEDRVSVRSEVARLTKLYEAAVKKYTENNPDLYSNTGGKPSEWKGLKGRPGAAAQSANPASGPYEDVDESPALAADDGKRKNKDESADERSRARMVRKRSSSIKTAAKEDPATSEADTDKGDGAGGNPTPAKGGRTSSAQVATDHGSSATNDNKYETQH